MYDIWSSLSENFDINLPRMSAIAIKEDDYDLGYYSPSPDNRIGYHFLDTNLSLYNQDRYTFEMYFAAYEYPNLCGHPGKTRFLFSEQNYRPGEISHKFVFPNSALAGSEQLSAAVGGALTWSFKLRNTSLPLPDPTHIYRYSKRIYSLFLSHDGFVAAQDDDGVVSIKLKNHEYYISCNMPITIAVFDNEMDAYEAMGVDFSQKTGSGRVMLIETALDIDVDEQLDLSFGMSHHSREKALEALTVASPRELLRSKWNKWFAALPTVSLDHSDEREQKLYYKSWWTIRQNFCNYPGWGFNVLESLPVYKGIWQWAVPAVEWYSSQDPEHSSEWIRKSLDILIHAQREDGYITHAAYLYEENPGEFWMKSSTIQNPQLPGTALRYYNVTGDIKSLRRWYPALEKYYVYLCRDFDECHKNLHMWALHSAYDTGLDTFPAFQEVTYGIDGNPPSEYCYGAILAAERYHYEKSMGKIAQLVGLDNYQHWYEEAKKTKSAVNQHLWDNERKWYGVLKENGELDTRIGIDGMFPLIYDIATSEQLSAAEPQFRRLIGEFGIRTCAEGEAGFFSDIYWRGPCWPKACSLAMHIAKVHYPHLTDDVFRSVLNANLRHPNIWECIDVTTGELARSNIGFYCTPCMSSNVGAGELIGTVWMHHGLDMFGTAAELPLIPMNDYHYHGLRITVSESGGKFTITAKSAEKEKNDVTFILPDGERITVTLKCEEAVVI